VRTIATAGHVDHGKSTLVLALTGTDPDRFPEEKARGLTIDLGFAFTTVTHDGHEFEVGFVDVPGHTRFLKNMLAGVGAVDTAMLVVAANEGWMPQTEEHVRILDCLEITHGLVVITKADLVDDETLDLARLEIEDRLGNASFHPTAIVACDARSGRDLDVVRAAIARTLHGSPATTDRDRPRLWVDRVFGIKGSGTVVTGTMTGGCLRVDDDVEIGIPGRPHRVRSIQSGHHDVTVATPGSRVALNLAGLDHVDTARGDVVVRPGQWRRTNLVDVALTVVPGAHVPERARWQAFVGSRECTVRFRRLDADGRWGRLRLPEPLPLAAGDRLVLRDPGSRSTVAGAEVLDVDPPPRPGDVTALGLPLVPRLLARRGWTTRAELAVDGGLTADEVAALVDTARVAGEAVAIGEWLTTPATVDALRREATAAALRHHADRPLDAGIELAVLAPRLRVEAARLRAVLDGEAALRVAQGVVGHVSHTPDPTTTAEGRALVAALEAEPFAPPDPGGLGAPAGLVRALVRAGALVDLDGVVFAASATVEARARIVAALHDRGALGVAEVRDLLGSTRKYVLPLLAWLDRTGVTRRHGDDRVAGPTADRDVGETRPT
jgi:selenocysteine-specific elongation factor